VPNWPATTNPRRSRRLLAWADTLTEITIEAWRTPAGDYIHLSLTRQLPEGITVRIYGVVAFAGRGIDGDLTPDARRPVPLAVLCAMATPGEAST
jgi:hypothetical protein